MRVLLCSSLIGDLSELRGMLGLSSGGEGENNPDLDSRGLFSSEAILSEFFLFSTSDLDL